nr:hypothetical protein [Deltaproteobacteria bacterium]
MSTSAEPPKLPAITDVTIEAKAEQKTLAGPEAEAASGASRAAVGGVTRTVQLPPHFPAWAAKLAELYFSGTTSMFVVHGNTFDVVRAGPDRWIGLADFL